MKIAGFVQGRMSSRRFPGKVLAPFRGRPMIDHVVDATRAALPDSVVQVITSVDPTDDPLAAYLERRGVPFFRGALEDVVARFIAAAEDVACDYVARVCADSPLLAPGVIAMAATVVRSKAVEPFDLVTTTLHRTFPKGQNVELIRVSSLRSLSSEALDAEDREHVTRFIHRHPDRYRIHNVESGNAALAQLDFCVDTVDDLHRLEHAPEWRP